MGVFVDCYFCVEDVYDFGEQYVGGDGVVED